MASTSHEMLHRIFQDNPEVITAAFEKLGIATAELVSAAPLSPDLTEVKPLERRVDTLVKIGTVDGDSFLLAVESQGKKDPEKPSAWVYYLGHLLAKYKIPPILLVVCQDASTAEWAAQPIRVGLPAWKAMHVFPLVLGPNNVPRITDAEEAARNPAWTVFSAITHAKDPDQDAVEAIWRH